MASSENITIRPAEMQPRMDVPNNPQAANDPHFADPRPAADAQGVKPGTSVENQGFDNAEQRHLEKKIAESRARAAAARAGINNYAPAPDAVPPQGPAVHVPSAGANAVETAAEEAPSRLSRLAQGAKKLGDTLENAMEKAPKRFIVKAMTGPLRIVRPLAVGYETIQGASEIADNLEHDDTKGASKALGRTLGKAGGLMVGIGGGIATGAALGTLLIPIPIVGSVVGGALGLAVGAAGGIAASSLLSDAGEWVGGLFGKSREEQEAIRKKGEILPTQYLEALKAETRAGANASPALHKATLDARSEYEQFLKDNTSDSRDEREARMKGIDTTFTNLAKRYAETMANAPANYNKAMENYKTAITAAVGDGEQLTSEHAQAVKDASVIYMNARRNADRAQGKTETPEELQKAAVEWKNFYVAQALQSAAAANPDKAAAATPSPSVQTDSTTPVGHTVESHGKPRSAGDSVSAPDTNGSVTVHQGASLFTIAKELQQHEGFKVEGADTKSQALAMALIIAKKNNIENFDDIRSNQALTLPSSEEIKKGMAQLSEGIMKDGVISYSGEMKGHSTSELIKNSLSTPAVASPSNVGLSVAHK